MTTLYLIRHSEPFKIHRGTENLVDTVFEENKKNPLSVNGENLAYKTSLKEEFKDIDTIWSSDYVRAMSTAKYFAYNNDLKVNIDYRLGERIHGINDWSELPKDFEIKQFADENYKIGYGESRKEVKERMLEVINELLNEYKDKKILVVCHLTCLAFLLSNWIDISFAGPYKFKDKIILEDKFNFCESFKLTFDENNKLLDIENINTFI